MATAGLQMKAVIKIFKYQDAEAAGRNEPLAVVEREVFLTPEQAAILSQGGTIDATN